MAGLGALALFVVFVPLPFPVCLFALTFHVPCPGCGLTRAARALLHGDVALAERFHPLALLVVPVVAAFIAASATNYLADGALLRKVRWRDRWVTGICLVLAVLILGVWVARFFGLFGGPVAI